MNGQTKIPSARDARMRAAVAKRFPEFYKTATNVPGIVNIREYEVSLHDEGDAYAVVGEILLRDGRRVFPVSGGFGNLEEAVYHSPGDPKRIAGSHLYIIGRRQGWNDDALHDLVRSLREV